MVVAGLADHVLAHRDQGGRAFLITGPIGSGKTETALRLTEGLRERGLAIGGVASPRVLVDRKTVGYRVRDLVSGQETPLCSLNPPGIPFRRFFFSPEALEFANSLLKKAAEGAQVILADEVGPLELAGGGFAPGMRAALSSPAFLVLTVRPSLVDAVRAWAGLPATTPVWALSPTEADIRRMHGGS